MLLEKLKSVSTFIFDIDGVLTNGQVLVTEEGEQLRQFNIKDGYALQLAVKRGYRVIIISGARGKGVETRLLGLGIKDIYLGAQEKIGLYQDILNTNQLKPEEIVYMGDDMPDLKIMQLVGIPACPADAVDDIKAVSMYISPKNGGEGCVRDILEKTMKLQQKWHDSELSASDGSL